MTVPPTYCPLPFMHLCINPAGDFALCCEDTMESDFASKKEYSFREIIDYQESPYLKWVCNNMLNHVPLKECSVCYREEEKDLVSKRKHEISRWGCPETKSRIQYLDLKLGNRCNLKCFTCDPASSSKIAEEYSELGWHLDPPFNSGQMGIPIKNVFQREKDWYMDPGFRKQISQLLPGLSMLKVTGGEPFLNNYFSDILHEIIDKNLNRISVQITTNGTIINEKILSALQQIDCSLVISLDGVGLVNDLIRFPSHFDQIVKNIRTYRENGIPIRINTTLSVYNILDVTNVFDFVHQELGNRITLIPLFQPQFLNPAFLPENIKLRCVQHIKEWKEKSCIPFAGYYETQVLQQLDSAETDLLQFEKFLAYTAILSDHRNIPIENYLPELAKFI